MVVLETLPSATCDRVEVSGWDEEDEIFFVERSEHGWDESAGKLSLLNT
jgi:hypothetical protein